MVGRWEKQPVCGRGGDGKADRRIERQSAGGDKEVDRRKERMIEMRKPNRSAAGRRTG